MFHISSPAHPANCHHQTSRSRGSRPPSYRNHCYETQRMYSMARVHLSRPPPFTVLAPRLVFVLYCTITLRISHINPLPPSNDEGALSHHLNAGRGRPEKKRKTRHGEMLDSMRCDAGLPRCRPYPRPLPPLLPRTNPPLFPLLSRS